MKKPKNQISILEKLNIDEIAASVLEAKRGDGSDNQISSVAKEMALHLTQGWIDKYADEDFNGPSILGVELPFFVWIDPLTLVVGVQDRLIAEPLDYPFPAQGNEWKTKTPPRSKQYGEASWLDDMSHGSQLATYALALREGTYVSSGVQQGLYAPGKGIKVNGVSDLRISARCAIKEIPPRFWPTKPGLATFTFTKKDTDSVKASLSNRAASIRAMRSNQFLIPWQSTGNHCFRQYGKTCEFLEKYCAKKDHPKGVPGYALSSGDPGMVAAKFALEQAYGSAELPENLVVLSASSYELGSTCMEKYRIETAGLDRNGNDEALDIGTGFHTGVAAVNRQIMRLQRESQAHEN